MTMIRMVDPSTNLVIGEIDLDQQVRTWNEAAGFEVLGDHTIVVAEPSDQVGDRNVFLLFLCWQYVSESGDPGAPVDMDAFTVPIKTPPDRDSWGVPLVGVRMEKFLGVPSEYHGRLPGARWFDRYRMRSAAA